MEKNFDTLYHNSNFENRQSKRRDSTQCCFMLRFEGSDVVGFYIFIQFHPTDTHDEERSVLSLHFCHWHHSISFTEGSPYYNAILPNWQIWLTSITKFVWHTSNKAIGTHPENCSIWDINPRSFADPIKVPQQSATYILTPSQYLYCLLDVSPKLEFVFSQNFKKTVRVKTYNKEVPCGKGQTCCCLCKSRYAHLKCYVLRFRTK